MTYLDDLSELVAKHEASLTAIKLVAFDVDGVLTDGRLHYSADGESIKVFHVRDGVGLKLLQDVGLAVAVITAKNSAMVATRISEMGIEHFISGSKDKRKALTELADSLGFSDDECCFVGDDMVDLPAMGMAGLSICPKDAYPLVLKQADICLSVQGGQGVARQVCDLLLMAQGKFETAYQLASRAEFERKR